MHQSMSNPRGGGDWATHGNLTVAYIPRVGILIGHHAFDLSILYSRREVNHLFLLILTILFCPGVRILIIFFRKLKCKKSPPYARFPPPLGLDTDRCIIFGKKCNIGYSNWSRPDVITFSSKNSN